MRLVRVITGHAWGSKKRSQDANGVSDTRRSNCRGYGKVATIPPESNLSVLNKFADQLLRRFDRIVLEDLRVAAMARGHFALSILDAGWSSLVTRLTHRAEN